MQTLRFFLHVLTFSMLSRLSGSAQWKWLLMNWSAYSAPGQHKAVGTIHGISAAAVVSRRQHPYKWPTCYNSIVMRCGLLRHLQCLPMASRSKAAACVVSIFSTYSQP